jgi:hypothetical protein
VPDLLNSLGTFFSGPTGKGIGTLAELGATGAGLFGNLSADRQRAAAAKQAQANMNLTPQQLAAMVSGAEQPLNRGLVQAVTSNVDASLAEKGLSQAPGLIATTESQALAPFMHENQQTALALVLQKLGLPAEFARTIPQNANLAPLLALLFKGGGAKPSFNPTTGPNPLPAIPDSSPAPFDWNPPGDTVGGTGGAF